MHWEELPQWAFQEIRRQMLFLRSADEATYYHCLRVGHNARRLAQAVGLVEKDQLLLEFVGIFHDLGKAKIPKGILHKPGALTESEFQVMKSHAVRSVEMMGSLGEIPFFQDVMAGVLHHHERLDGLGYPFRLEGDEIPMSSRIVLIADTYDAMTSNRPYRKPLPPEVACKELKTHSGTQFDPYFVKIFLDARKFWERESPHPEMNMAKQVWLKSA